MEDSHADVAPLTSVPPIRARRRGLPWVKSTIRVTRQKWRNWSGELESTPSRLYCDEAGGPWRSPRTLQDLQDIVRDALAAGVSVRVFGSSHSWAPLVPNDGGFVVDNRMIGTIDGVYRPRITPARPGGKARVTVPPGVLSGELEDWLWEAGYTLPASAFEDCFTVGGMAATATHGTGYAQATVSDMVVGATFVDGLGLIREWSRETATEDQLAAFQAGLGCLGLIYELTLEVEPRYEVLHEARCVPYDSLFADTPAARRALQELHETHSSIEFFWWSHRFSGLPFLSAPEVNPDVWILSTRPAPPDSRPRGRLRTFLHLELIDMLCMTFSGLLMLAMRGRAWEHRVVLWITCFTNVWVWLRSGAWRMSQRDANHFVNAGGVEFVRAVAAEWSVPYERRANPDDPEGYERLRASFAVLHDLVTDAARSHPVDDPRSAPVALSVEMRTLKASSALLSPGYEPAERRDTVFYAAPEIVTTAGHPAWPEFSTRAHHAMTANPGVFGTEVRCHLAKPLHPLPHPDHPIGGTRSYLRERYRKAGTWDRFLAVRADVDPRGVFLNDYLRAWFFQDDSGSSR